MGCKTCKGKKDKNTESKSSNLKGDHHINLVPESIQNGDFSGNFILKLVAFVILIVGWPIITLALFYIVFVNFFIPKKDGKKVIGDMFSGLFEKYAKHKAKRFLKKRAKEFEKNRSYDGDSELLDIEVFETEENNEDTES